MTIESRPFYVQILLDGPGVLKFSGFGLSRVEEENLEELFAQFSETAETWDGDKDTQQAEVPNKYKTLGSPTYMAPEVIQHGELSILSDLWSFGAVLFEMYTGT